MKLYNLNLQLFTNYQEVSNPNVTTDSGLSPEMKTYYDMTLIDEAGPLLVHDQFGQKRNIPKNGGKTIEFRKFAPLNKAVEPLTEGVTPEGLSLTVSSTTATVAQFGRYVTLSDVLELTALDNVIVETTKLIGKQAGLSLDTVVRNVLQAGTNVSYASKRSGNTVTVVKTREELDDTATLTVDEVYKVVTKLRSVNAPTINGDYVGIIHPHVAYDLMRDPEWIDAHKYATPENIYYGEIGKIGGVRFVQTSEAKILGPAYKLGSSVYLTVSSAVTSSTTVNVSEALTADEAAALAGKKIHVEGETTELTISSATSGAAGSAYLTLSAAATIAKDKKLYGGRPVYGCLFIADGAYGTTEINGGGLRTIIKQKGSAGTADPLDQRSSIGWTAMKTAKILIPDYLVRLECCSKYGTAESVSEN